MPSVYLSPSVQDYHSYTSGLGTEEYHMNLIADSMVPWLRKCGISFIRNNPFDTLPEMISRSNRNSPDFHLALHSNIAPGNLSGLIQGPDIYYLAGSRPGKKAADIFAENLKKIYPVPALVAVIPNDSLSELKKTKAPAVLAELAYHDNEEDARWLIENREKIAYALALSLSEYLKLPSPGTGLSVKDMIH